MTYNLAEPTGDRRFALLQASVAHLADLVGSLAPDRLRAQAYPSEWSIADVLSHIGSGAVIFQRRIDDAVAGATTPDDFAPGVWDAWNAKSPEAKAADALVADRALVDRVGSLSPAEQASILSELGPFRLDLAGLVGLRLNEHLLHTWDVEVVGDPAAVLPPEPAGEVVDNLELIVRFAAKPTGSDRALHVHTTDPERQFSLVLAPDAVSLAPLADAGNSKPDLALPTEAFVRLAYGRLDPGHTPAVTGDTAVLDELRRVFPGI